MTNTKRVRLWDNNTGSEYIADWITDHWEFAEREWGGVQWYDVEATPYLLREVTSSLSRGSRRAIA